MDSEYQIWTGLIRTLNNGESIYGLRVAFEGQQVFGDIYRSEDEAKAAIPGTLAELKRMRKERHEKIDKKAQAE